VTASRKYTASGPEAEFEPGARGRVLRNLLGIVRVRDMNEAESQALELAQEAAIDRFGPDHRFTARDICALHRLWLGPIYTWAGTYRSVNIGKGGFQFAHAPLIPGLMRELEHGALARHTPSRPCPDAELAGALAAVHAELILVHPFRDGNGRLARLLALLMGLQAGLPPLDFSPLLGRGRLAYIAGIHAATGRNYAPMTAVYVKVIERSRRRDASNTR
jgi:cell filamentation protein, protein adenylyltransferase